MAKQSVDPFDILAQQNQALQKPARSRKSSKPKVFDTLFGSIDDSEEDENPAVESISDSMPDDDNKKAGNETSQQSIMSHNEKRIDSSDEPTEDADSYDPHDGSSSNDDEYLKKMQKMQELYAHNTDIQNESIIRHSTGRRGRPPKPNRFEGGTRSALKMTEENAKHLKIMASRMMITQSEYMEKLIHKEKLLAGTEKDLRPLDLDKYDLGYFNVQRSIFFTKADDEFLKERQAYLVVSRTRYLNYLLKMDQL